jgi:hypothetical protein
MFWLDLLMMSQHVTLPSKLVPAPSRLRLASGKPLPTQLPKKKAKKATGKTAGRFKINEPAPMASASTPPSGAHRKIPIQHSKRYACYEHISFLTISNS